MSDKPVLLDAIKQWLDTPLHKAAVSAIICLCLAALLYQSKAFTHPWLDQPADDYFENTITQAGLAYGTTRLINASVSVIMESNLQVQPAGVGLSLAVGQVLDPLNDMAERLSDVLVTAIVSLGVQKLVYEISIAFVPPILAVVLVIIAGLSFAPWPLLQRLQQLLLRTALILCVVRLFLPLSALVNGVVYDHFFAEQIHVAKQAIAAESASIQGLADFSQTAEAPASQAAGSFWQQWMDETGISQTADFLDQKSSQIKQAFLSKQQYAAGLIDQLLTLTYLYVGLFVIQVIMLPLMLFYGLLKLGQLLTLRTD